MKCGIQSDNMKWQFCSDSITLQGLSWQVYDTLYLQLVFIKNVKNKVNQHLITIEGGTNMAAQ